MIKVEGIKGRVGRWKCEEEVAEKVAALAETQC